MSSPPVRAFIEVALSGQPSQVVPILELPFLIGRGTESGNHLPLDDMRVSRKCVAISGGSSGWLIEDLGQRNGILVNGRPTKGQTLSHGDRISLGADEKCQLVFRLPPEVDSQEDAEEKLRGLLGSFGGSSADELKGLRLLLEATQLLQSELPLDAVLATMLDHAVAITHADRGMLLEPDSSGMLQVRVARGRNGDTLPSERMNPSRSLLGRAIELETAVINEDLRLADLNVQTAQ
ncbi:MAG TPA: FHA domain-containing protein, partial [Candidatus Dormibacteraeota bacterium]|nr:FHA domain-containing protein [Candidatus Dormibacteraeota bacterium]